MAAAAMSLELHDCGIHAVWTGRSGQCAAYQLVPVMLKRHKSLSGRTAAHTGNELTCSLPHRDEPPATS
jgi:hypothetical protein